MSTRFKGLAISIGTLLIGFLVSFQAVAENEPSKFYGPTVQHESLWQIANKTKPSADISTQQMSIAIYKANPRAFKSNINTLYTGVRLRIPSEQEIKNTSLNEANQFIHTHNQAWLKPNMKVVSETTQHWLRPEVNFVAAPTLKQEIVLLTKKINEIREDTENRLSDLEADNLSLEQRLVAMAERVNVLIEDVSAHSISINKLLDIMNEELQAIDTSLSETIIGSIVVILFILIAYLTISLFKKPKPKIVKEPKQKFIKQDPVFEDDDDLEDEYDFINSDEGIPAKIDLARAYIDMDNPNSALKILEEVISKGNDQQQKIAQTLIQRIRKTETV